MSTPQDAYTIAAYLRIASIAVALYDYLETQPTTFRFYREHLRSRRLTISFILFVLLRFVSICTLTVSNVGFFYGGFTPTTCSQFYLVPPSFKVLQAMVSQAILGVRAFNLSRRSKYVGWCTLALYFTATILQWVTTLYGREPQIGDNLGHDNCRAFNRARVLGAWIFYAIAIIYDVLTTGTSVWYLLKYKLKSTSSVMSKLTRMMLYDGLGYLVVLTAANILNLVLFLTGAEIQTAGSSLAYCVAWIMSQRLLIHLYDASRERREEDSYDAAITVTKKFPSAHEVNRAARSQFQRKSTQNYQFTRPETDVEDIDPGRESLSEDVSVQVRIGSTVRHNHQYTRTFELEDYSQRSRR